MLVRDGRRHSLFRAYVHPLLDRPNLTLLTGTQVRRVLLEGRRAVGVEVDARRSSPDDRRARPEVILSLGAMHTPKVLMHSGIGDRAELHALGIPVVQHLPGVGQNLQDHVSFGCIWEYAEPIAPRNSGSEATLYWKAVPICDAPDLLFCQVEFPVPSDRTATRGVPQHGWTMFAGLAQPKSRGGSACATAEPLAPADRRNMMSDPEDMRPPSPASSCAASSAMRRRSSPSCRGEAMPGDLDGSGDGAFIRDSAVTYWHQSCTAKMGRDDMSVVDACSRSMGSTAFASPTAPSCRG